MYPDDDPRKNAITTLEAVQAAAQLGVALKGHAPFRAHENRVRAMQLWRFFEDVQLLGADGLVHDNVTGTVSAHAHMSCSRSERVQTRHPRFCALAASLTPRRPCTLVDC